MNPDVGERHRGANRGAWNNDGRPGELGKIDVRLRDAHGDPADSDRVPARPAWVGLPGLLMVFLAGCQTVMVSIGHCRTIVPVLVGGRSVVMIRVIVADVFVDVQGRRR
jgi:hypothetical protein